jgi:hypothetical protein
MTVNEFLTKNPDACQSAKNWLQVGNYITIQDAWNDCKRSDWMLWALKRPSFNDQKILRLLACAFVRRTPLSDGRTVWDLLTDERSRNAVIVAERYAKGNATLEELREARNAAAYAAAAYAAAAYAVDAAAAVVKSVQADIIREYTPTI